MRNVMFALALVLAASGAATADDTKPAQPAQPPAVQPVQPGAVQPRPLPIGGIAPARITQLEEEVEMLEANRDVKKAYVKAAAVGVDAAKVQFDLIAKANASGSEVNTAKFALEAAKAQLEIREAELKEVEVKIKHAKKRLEDAKAVPPAVRPLPIPVNPAPNPVRPVRPLPVDPNKNIRFAADEKTAAELKAKIAEVEAQLAKNAEQSKKAGADLKEAESELAAIKKAAQLGRIKAGAIEAAEAKVKDAKDMVEKLTKERVALDASLTDLRAKLKELEK